MTSPPARNLAGDIYADAHSIRYEEGRMVCQRMHWVYRIYYPNEEPSSEYGTICDIAVDHNGLVWYRDLRHWVLADDKIEDNNNMPRQKHPLLRGRYRLDRKKNRWKGATCYYQATRRSTLLKTEPGSVEKDAQGSRSHPVKTEPVHANLSTEKPPAQTAQKEERETIFIDLALKENEPLRRFVFLLPHASSSKLPALPDPSPTPVAAPEPTPGPSSVPPATASETFLPQLLSSVPTRSSSPPTPSPQQLETGVLDALSASPPIQPSLPLPPLDEEEEFDFQYPEFQLANPIPPPFSEPRKLQDVGVQTEDMQHWIGSGSLLEWISDGRAQAARSIESDVPHNARRSLSASDPTFSDPDATLVHMSPPHGIGSSKTSALDFTLPAKDAGDSHFNAAGDGSKSHNTLDGRVESLMERLFVESTKDRRDMLMLIQMMGQRLERLEEKQLKAEGLRYSMDINGSRDHEVLMGDMFMGQGNLVEGVGSTSTPRGVRSSSAEFMDADSERSGVDGGYYLGTATLQGPSSMAESKKRKASDVEAGEVGVVDTSAKKSRIIA